MRYESVMESESMSRWIGKDLHRTKSMFMRCKRREMLHWVIRYKCLTAAFQLEPIALQ